MLGTRPKGIQPSEPPKPKLNFIDSFTLREGQQIPKGAAVVHIGFRFGFISAFLPEATKLAEKLRALVGINSQNVCVAAGRFAREINRVDIGAFEFPKFTRDAIADCCAKLAFRFRMEEFYTDDETADFLNQSNFWQTYTQERHAKILLETEKWIAEIEKLEMKKRNLIDWEKKPFPDELKLWYDVAIIGLHRPTDHALRRLALQTPLEQHRVGLTKELMKDNILEELQPNRNSILSDAAAGLVQASMRYL